MNDDVQPSASEINYIDRWAYWEGAFSEKDCQDIIDWGLTQQLKPANVNGHLQNLETSYRESNVTWMYPDTLPDVWYKLEYIVKEMNPKCFGFDLRGFRECLQFCEYKAPNGNYNWHIDAVPLGIIRKLSIVLQLSDPDDYEGGELQLSYRQDSPEHVVSLKKERGLVYMFPSWEVHRVAPVTKGTRYSLVGWVTGPSFR